MTAGRLSTTEPPFPFLNRGAAVEYVPMFNLPLSPRCPAVADGGALAYNDSGVSTIKIKLVFVNIKVKRK